MAEWHHNVAAGALQLGVVLRQALPGVQDGGTTESFRSVERGRVTQHSHHPDLALVRAIGTLHFQDGRVDLYVEIASAEVSRLQTVKHKL